MWSEAHITILVSAASAVVVASIAFAGTRGTSLTSLLTNEQKRLDECQKALRDSDAKHEAEKDALKADRDKERQRADMLSLELTQFKLGMIGGVEKPPKAS